VFGNSKYLEKVDSLLSNQEAAIKEVESNNTTLLIEVSKLANSLEGHMSNEEVAMREHTKLLKGMNDKLANIDIELAKHPADLELKMTLQKDLICAKAAKLYATKEELYETSRSVRREGKLIAGVVAAILSAVVAFNELGIFNHGG